MTWTKVSKPGATTWTAMNARGKEQYDQPDITYDSALTFYDGIDMSQWTPIAKPIGESTILVGMATGLLMPPTYATSHRVGANQWTRIAKPT